MPYLRKNVYYMKRNLPGVGIVRRSLETESKTRAQQLERAVLRLHERGHLAPVKAFAAGKLSAHALAEALESGKVGELQESLRNGPSPTLQEAIDETTRLETADVAPSTRGRYSASFSHLLAFHGPDVLISDVLTDDAVKEFKAHRLREGMAKQTINNDLQAASLLATRAVDQGWISKRPKIKRYPYEKRVRYLEPDELERYTSALRPAYRPLMRLLVGSGIRLGEAEALRASDVQGNRLRVRAGTGKTASAARNVSLPDWLATELAGREAGKGGLLFSEHARRSVQKEHSKACNAEGIEDYTIHDHRHTFAVSVAREGLPLGTLQVQLGHSTIQQTMKYATFHPDYQDTAPYFGAVAKRYGLERETDQ